MMLSENSEALIRSAGVTSNASGMSYSTSREKLLAVLGASITLSRERLIPAFYASFSYVLNTNSKKIHYASCSSVDDMKESNKAFTNDYDQAIADGYKPCGRCKP